MPNGFANLTTTLDSRIFDKSIDLSTSNMVIGNMMCHVTYFTFSLVRVKCIGE